MYNLRKPPPPFSVIIFGATGDLAHRKILPAFYALARQGLLPEQCHIIGFARRDWTDDTFRAEMRQGVALNQQVHGVFAEEQVYRIDH